MKFQFILLVMMFSSLSYSQKDDKITNQSILNDIESEINETDSNNEKLVTKIGFNVFIQRKVMNYLTGVSDLSLAKFYSTYTGDNDKLNLGFNIPLVNKDAKRLSWVINPILEADFKNNFATLYKDDKWKNNIRGGFKLTYLIPLSTMNFWDGSSNKSRINDFKILRTKKYCEIEEKFAKDSIAMGEKVVLINGELISPTSQTPTQRDMKNKKNKAFESVGVAEADYLEKEKAFTWLQTAWISGWTFFPLTEAEKYVSNDNNQLFQKTKFKLWEVNFQATYLFENVRFGTFYLSSWVKYFQNNSANADLMTKVDYLQYSQFPGANPQNLAVLEANDAYIGTFKEFKTTNANFQFVYMVPLNTLIKPGVSIRYEKNWGDYSPTNLRFGLPLSIQGKDKPINIELQYRLNDINNYKSLAEHEPTKIIGVSVGFPITLLYK